MFTYRSSELGGCIRRLVALRQGYEKMPPPQQFRELFAEGNRWETITVDHLLSRGFDIPMPEQMPFPVDEGQSYMYIRILEDVGVSGHVDGFIAPGTDDNDLDVSEVPWKILEIKSMSHNQFEDFVDKGWERGDVLMEKYKWQVSPYMIAADMELMFVGVDRDSDEANPSYHALYQEKPFYSLGDITRRVLEIERLAEGTLPDCDQANYPCPVYYLGCTHNSLDADEVISQLITDKLVVSDRMATDKKALAEINKLLGTELGDRKKVRVEEGTVSWTKGRETKYLDEAAMIDDGIDVESYKRTRKGEPYVKVYRRRTQESAGPSTGEKVDGA